MRRLLETTIRWFMIRYMHDCKLEPRLAPSTNLALVQFSGCSYSLYPHLLTKYSAVIYNGDFDTCVPWTQNEQWTSLTAQQQGYKVKTRWQPWPNPASVAGYVTQYVTAHGTNFTFMTFKGAGHMVPMYKPRQAFDWLQRFIFKGADFNSN